MRSSAGALSGKQPERFAEPVLPHWPALGARQRLAGLAQDAIAAAGRPDVRSSSTWWARAERGSARAQLARPRFAHAR